MIRASAPGKLMLAGEYTVAIGNSCALSIAVDRRVTVTVEQGPKWLASSEDMGWDAADAQEDPILAAAIDHATELGMEGGHIHIASELGAGSDKPGLGASAAVCVATMGALHASCGLEPPTLEQCMAVHSVAQGGRGSGYDVATALHGGLIRFNPSAEGGPTVTPLEWVDGLHARVFFTGQGASTVAMLGRLQHFREARPSRAKRCFAELRQSAAAFIDAWVKAELRLLLDSAANVQEALVELDRKGRIGIQEGRHARLMSVVEDAGALARTSGAGGGDCLWAFAESRETLDQVEEKAVEEGFSALEVDYPSDGLSLETVG